MLSRQDPSFCSKGALYNAKTLGRGACLYQSLLMGALVMASLWILALFPQETTQIFPVISRMGLYSRSSNSLAHYATFYCLGSAVFWTLPYVLVSILGTRTYCLVAACSLSNVVILLHFAVLWISAMLCGVNYLLQIIIASVLLVSQVLVTIILGCALQNRLHETDDLFSVRIIRGNPALQSQIRLYF